MNATMRGRLELDPTLAKHLGLPTGIRVPAIDEDEATLAVAAARRALQGSSTRPERIEVVDAKGAPWPTVALLALGLKDVPRAEVSSASGPPPRGTLRLSAHAPRVDTPAFAATTTGALATAEWSEAKERLDLPLGAKVLDRAGYDALAAAERKALAQVPMGAYVPRATWDATAEARYRLLASFCTTCKRGMHPPIPVCPMCGKPTQTRELTEGSLYSHTVISPGGGPSEFDPLQDTEGTYGVAIVEFADDIRVAGMLTDTDLSALRVGQRVKRVFRRLYAHDGLWRYGTKFRVQG